MPTSSTALAQWVTRTSQWCRRTSGRLPGAAAAPGARAALGTATLGTAALSPPAVSGAPAASSSGAAGGASGPLLVMASLPPHALLARRSHLRSTSGATELVPDWHRTGVASVGRASSPPTSIATSVGHNSDRRCAAAAEAPRCRFPPVSPRFLLAGRASASSGWRRRTRLSRRTRLGDALQPRLVSGQVVAEALDRGAGLASLEEVQKGPGGEVAPGAGEQHRLLVDRTIACLGHDPHGALDLAATRPARGGADLRQRDEAKLRSAARHELVGLADVLPLDQPRAQPLPQAEAAEHLLGRRAIGRQLRIGDRQVTEPARRQHLAGAVDQPRIGAPEHQPAAGVGEVAAGNRRAALLEQRWPFRIRGEQHVERSAVLDLRGELAGRAGADHDPVPGPLLDRKS